MFELLSAGYKTERGFMKKGEIYQGWIDHIDFPNKGKVLIEDQTVTVKNGIPVSIIPAFIKNTFTIPVDGRNI